MDRIATEIFSSRRSDATRVSNPAINSAPQMTSMIPTKGAAIVGEGIPIFSKRPTPSAAENRNF